MRPNTKQELKEIINQTIKEKGYNCDLNFIDTSLITDMGHMFDGQNSTETFLNGMFLKLKT